MMSCLLCAYYMRQALPFVVVVAFVVKSIKIDGNNNKNNWPSQRSLAKPLRVCVYMCI